MQLPSGALLQNGKYKIIKTLGQGGFGITYLGEHVELGRQVAIKEFFMSDYCEREDDSSYVTMGTKSKREMVERYRQKFIKEAQIIAALKHHHIINIYDIFKENNTAYYVMEYIECGSLGNRVGETGMKQQDAVHYIRQVASALSYLHDQKMNHLDIKPGNILVDKEDNTILIDFGLAKHYDDDGKQTTTTPVGISHGYAPTEQYIAGGVAQFSPATDIYALGATLYKMLTGITPPNANSIAKGLPTDKLQARGVSPQLIHAITRAMKFDPDDRLQSIADFLSLLDGKAAADNEGTKPVGDLGGGGGNNRGGSTAGVGTQPGRKAPGGNGGSGSTTLPGGNKPAPRHSKKNLWVALAVVVGLICGVAGYTHFSGRGSAPAPAAQEEVVTDTLATDSIDVAEVAALIHNVTSPEEEATDQTEDMSRLQAENDRMREQLRQDSIANAQREAAAAAEAARQAQAEAERQAQAEAERQAQAEAERQAEARRQEEARRRAATRGNITETVNGVTFKMVYVQGGTFSMGAQKTNSSGTNYDSEADSDESPVHSVTLGDYYIAETEVTQALWQAVMGNNPSYFKGENRPVDNVSWDDAVSFCKELSRLTGRTYVLPTEAQWEYAARGGKNSTGSKYSGSHSISNVAWYSGNSDSKTHEVKGKMPNALGIYDMSGNVWEWCSDYWTANYNATPNTSLRVLRGGSWCNYAQYCRVSHRGGFSPSYRYSDGGFRVALSVNR